MDAELLVEHPDDEPDIGIELRGGEGGIEVPEVVVTGQDEGRGLGDTGRAQDRAEPVVTDDETHAAVGQPLLVVGARADRDDSSPRVRSSSIVRRPRWSRPQTTA